jgi:MFS family permease
MSTANRSFRAERSEFRAWSWRGSGLISLAHHFASGCVIAALTFGPRSAMGFFQLPMLADTGWSRSDFGLAMAIQNLMWGLGQPFFGALADKKGHVARAGAVGDPLRLRPVPDGDAASVWYLHLGGGLLVGLAIASGSFGIILAAFARNVTPEQRSFAFGLGTAAGSAGMFLFAPFSQMLIDALGWSDSLLVMSAMMLIVPVLAVPLRGNSDSGTQKQTDVEQSIGDALREAFGHQSYLLLTAGFFVCGFQVAFITAHFPAYIGDIGIDARYAVMGIALIGFFNIIGSLASGVIGQKYSKPIFLALIYIGRSIAVTVFLLLPQIGHQRHHLFHRDGPVVAVDRAADQFAGRDHVRHALSRHARRHRLPVAPDRLVPRRLARRLSCTTSSAPTIPSGGSAWRSACSQPSSTGRSRNVRSPGPLSRRRSDALSQNCQRQILVSRQRHALPQRVASNQ